MSISSQTTLTVALDACKSRDNVQACPQSALQPAQPESNRLLRCTERLRAHQPPPPAWIRFDAESRGLPHRATEQAAEPETTAAAMATQRAQELNLSLACRLAQEPKFQP